MNKSTIQKFELISDERLQSISGSGARDAAEVTGVIIGTTSAGAGIGSVFPGVGTAAGALLGGLYGTGLWAFAKASKW